MADAAFALKFLRDGKWHRVFHPRRITAPLLDRLVDAGLVEVCIDPIHNGGCPAKFRITLAGISALPKVKKV
jgi:hypothetical protein